MGLEGFVPGSTVLGMAGSSSWHALCQTPSLSLSQSLNLQVQVQLANYKQGEMQPVEVGCFHDLLYLIIGERCINHALCCLLYCSVRQYLQQTRDSLREWDIAVACGRNVRCHVSSSPCSFCPKYLLFCLRKGKEGRPRYSRWKQHCQEVMGETSTHHWLQPLRAGTMVRARTMVRAYGASTYSMQPITCES